MEYKMFCVECGKEGPIFKDGVCVNCYLKSNSFTNGPEIVDIATCAHCGAFKYKNTWTQDLFNYLLRKTIKDNFDISKDLQKIDINTDCKEAKDGYECKVYISGFIDGHEIIEEHNLLIRIKRTVCDVCSKRSGGYHEAIIQVRTDNRKLNAEELGNIQSFVKNQVENLRAKGNRGLFITDIGEEHGGLDFFLSDRAAAQIITKKLQDEFGGNVKQSSKNIGMKDSRQLYRMTYLLRIPSFKKDDFIELKNKYFLVKSVHSNNVKLLNLSDWEETTLELKNMENAKMLGGKELIKKMIVVSQTKNDIQVMDEKTYKIQIIKKPKTIEYKDDKIPIIKIDDLLFIYLK